MNILYYLCEEAVKEPCTKEIWFYVVIPLLSAFIGGMITFLGVLITIKFEKKSRDINFKNKYRPLLLMSKDGGTLDVKRLVMPVNLTKLKTINVRTVLDSTYDTEEYVMINNFVLFNTEMANFSFLGVKINNKTYLFKEHEDLFVPKERYILIQTNGYVFCCNGKFENLELIIADLFGNKYSVKCIYKEKKEFKKFGENGQVEKEIRIIDVSTVANPQEIKR